MIAFEALFTFITVMAIITLIGRPLAKAYSEKVQSVPHSLTIAEQKQLLERVSLLESELADVRRSLISLQDSSDFAMKMLERANGEKFNLTEKSGVPVKLRDSTFGN